MNRARKTINRLGTIALLVLTVTIISTECGKKKRGDQQAINTDYSLILPFDEPYRPQYHFTPDSMWMNDPNGLFYLDGVYHLFYQYHPYSTQWGPMHWGHASSTDLMHWKHLPVALYPDSLGTIFSGSAVVDRFNTSGFAGANEIPVVAIYTIHSPEDVETQAIAYSNDKGNTWNKYVGNPVILNPGRKDFRDPKVIWHSETGQWIMILAAGNHVEFYRSPDLKQWTYASSFGYTDGCHEGIWECPDMYKLQVPGESGASKWIISVSVNNGGPNGGSGIQYFTGSFNGTYFKNDNPPSTTLWFDSGPDNYAGSTWSDIPSYDGRRIFIGWFTNVAYCGNIPTTTWRGSQTLPRSVSLIETAFGLRLASYPVKEVENLYGKKITKGPTLIKGTSDFGQDLPDLRQAKISCSFMADTAELPVEFGIRLTSDKNDSLVISINTITGEVVLDRSACGNNDFSELFPGLLKANLQNKGKELSLDIYTDRSTAECFFNNGTGVISARIFPEGQLSRIEIFAEKGRILLKEGSVTAIHGIRDGSEKK